MSVNVIDFFTKNDMKCIYLSLHECVVIIYIVTNPVTLTLFNPMSNFVLVLVKFICLDPSLV